MKKLIHLAAHTAHPDIWTQPFRDALGTFGHLTVLEDADQIPLPERAALIREHNIVLTSWGASTLPAELAVKRGNLEYICHLTGTIREYVPLALIDAGILVTNWGDAPAKPIAEGAMTLLLATLKDLHRRVQSVRGGEWAPPRRGMSDTLHGMNIGVYGFGVIARAFVDLLRPFGAVVRIYDPYVTEVPPPYMLVESLDALFEQSTAIVIHAGLTDATRGSVTAALLAKLPDGGIVINTARGAIVDQDALFGELERGRLRAGLDVLEPDHLPADHPTRTWNNVLLSAHTIALEWTRANGPEQLSLLHHICLKNLQRHLQHEPLEFVVDRERYLLST